MVNSFGIKENGFTGWKDVELYKERIEGIKEKLKKFYVDKIEQKKTLIR